MAKILIVEDNKANMKLTSFLLLKADHSVLCAVDAETGVALARTERPDLILMDIQLPGMDGLAATALLKNDPATSNIPIIMVTANIDHQARLAGLEAGAEEFLTKPVDRAELLNGASTHPEDARQLGGSFRTDPPALRRRQPGAGRGGSGGGPQARRRPRRRGPRPRRART